MDSGLTVFEGIKILYEDNHLIVCIKPAGVLSQSDGSGSPDMLTILKRYIKDAVLDGKVENEPKALKTLLVEKFKQIHSSDQE